MLAAAGVGTLGLVDFDVVDLTNLQRQLLHGTKDVGRDGIVIALMAALTESTLRLLSNTSAYPDSANYPNDGDGGDHDSLGLFQMRPSTGWGSSSKSTSRRWMPVSTSASATPSRAPFA